MSTTSGADTAGVLQALTRILEHADALLAEGYSPHVALVAALAEHRPRVALARVARAAWALALREERTDPGLDVAPHFGASDGATTLVGSGQQGGGA